MSTNVSTISNLADIIERVGDGTLLTGRVSRAEIDSAVNSLKENFGMKTAADMLAQLQKERLTQDGATYEGGYEVNATGPALDLLLKRDEPLKARIKTLKEVFTPHIVAEIICEEAAVDI